MEIVLNKPSWSQKEQFWSHHPSNGDRCYWILFTNHELVEYITEKNVLFHSIKFGLTNVMASCNTSNYIIQFFENY